MRLKTSISLVLFFSVASFSCNKYAITNRQYKRQARSFAREIKKEPSSNISSAAKWVGTTNFGLRKPDFVIIHHTAQNSCEQTLQTFTLPRTQVSAHYVICKDGTVHHMLNDYLRAWHAGRASWGNNKDINSASVGIELDNDGFETFPSIQIQSLLTVLDTLKSKYAIPAANFIGHADIAPTRKNDPNANFPWQLLSQSGYGLWYGDTSAVIVPDHFNDLQALRIIGYSVADSVAAVVAFKRHFNIQDSTTIISASDRKILYDVMKRYE